MLTCQKCQRPVMLLTNGRCDECNGGWKRQAGEAKPKRSRKQKQARQPSPLEQAFSTLWKLHGGTPEPVTEYRFDQNRKFRFDFAWVEQKVAVEMEGGIWTGGAHARPKGIQRDIEKANLAHAQGWFVMRYSAKDVRERPVQMIEEVVALIQERGDRPG